MNNNERLNNKRLVLKRQKETVLSKHQIKKEETRPSSQSPLSPKKRKSKTLEISSKSTLKLAVATRLKRDYAFGDTQQCRFFQQKPFTSEKRFKTTSAFVSFSRPNFSFFAMKKNEMQRFSSRIRAFERKRDSSSLSPLQKHIEYTTQAAVTKRESTKKTFATYLFIVV